MRWFYLRYHLLVYALPSYLLSFSAYGIAWVAWLVTATGGVRQAWPVFILWALVCYFGAPVYGALGFILTGLWTRKTNLEPEYSTKLANALACQQDAKTDIVVTPVELGPVPLIAAGGFHAKQLWISTKTLRSTDPDTLRCLVAHEQAHMLIREYRWEPLMRTLFWAVSLPLAYLARDAWPLMLVDAVAHVSLGLRMDYALRARQERTADQQAAQVCGRNHYVRALASYLRQFEQPGKRFNLRARLQRMGLDNAELNELADIS